MMPLRNRYFIMRHGESEANRAGIIVSDAERGIASFGLTGDGRQQVQASLGKHRQVPVSIIYSSDFLRARETARLAGRFYGVDPVIVTDLLRERFFGDYEGREDRYYHEVWAMDRSGIDEYPARIESPEKVAGRVLRLTGEIENKHEGRIVLLISHGDTLQILMALFSGIPARNHRDLPHLDKAEIREIVPHESFTVREVV